MDAVLEILGVSGVIILGILLILIGFIGSVLPALPGVPLAALSVILVHFTLYPYPWYILAIVILLTLAISIVDYVVPIWGTKKLGGSKQGVRGSTIGLVIGALISLGSGGLGIIALFAGPFLGAYIGELYFAKADQKTALRSAWGSLLGFIAGTFGKLIVVVIITIIFIAGLIQYF